MLSLVPPLLPLQLHRERDQLLASLGPLLKRLQGVIQMHLLEVAKHLKNMIGIEMNDSFCFEVSDMVSTELF